MSQTIISVEAQESIGQESLSSAVRRRRPSAKKDITHPQRSPRKMDPELGRAINYEEGLLWRSLNPYNHGWSGVTTIYELQRRQKILCLKKEDKSLLSRKPKRVT